MDSKTAGLHQKDKGLDSGGDEEPGKNASLIPSGPASITGSPLSLIGVLIIGMFILNYFIFSTVIAYSVIAYFFLFMQTALLTVYFIIINGRRRNALKKKASSKPFSNHLRLNH